MASRLQSQSSFEKIRNELICSICLDPFVDPKILPCFHTFCKKCLENTTRSSRGALLCPTCRSKTNIFLESEVEKLPNNFLVCKVMETLAEEEQAYVCICTNCDDNIPARWKCLDCRKFLCDSCYEEHNKSSLYRETHRLRDVDDHDDFEEANSSLFSSGSFEKEERELPVMSCENHLEKECELYCKDCKKCMCTICFAVEHRNHEMQAMADVAKEQKDMIRKLLTRTEMTTINVQHTIGEIDTVSARIEQRHQDLVSHVGATVAEIIHMTQQKANELYLQLDVAKAQRFKVIEAQKMFLELEKLKLEGACQFANDVLSCDNPAEVLTWNDQLLKRMGELNHGLYEENSPEVNDFIDCSFDITDIKRCINKASVLSSNTIPSNTKLTTKTIAVQGKETILELVTIDKEGNPSYSLLDDVKVKLYSPNGEQVDLAPLADLKDGRYVISFIAQEAGNHRVLLTIRDSTAWKTPLPVYVSRDYMMIHHAVHGFGTKGEGEGELSGPCFATVDEEDNILVAESQNNRVQLFDSLGNLKKVFGREGKNLGEFRCPTATGFLKDGSLVVLDSYNSRVQILSPEGNVRSFGKEGKGARELYYPLGLSVDEKNRIIVADTGNNAIKVFNQTGDLISVYGAPGEGKLRNPLSAVYSRGQLIVADSGNNCIRFFFEDGTLLHTLSSINNERISGPCRVSTDKNGFLLICEKGLHNLKVLDQDGKLLMVFSAGGRTEGYLMHPQSAVVTESGKVVVADWGNHRIQVFN